MKENSVTAEINYEAIEQCINDWFTVSLYHSHDNPKLTTALQKLKDLCRSVVLNQDRTTFADFYQQLALFNKNFGADQQETNDLCELLSYFQPAKDETTKS